MSAIIAGIVFIAGIAIGFNGAPKKTTLAIIHTDGTVEIRKARRGHEVDEVRRAHPEWWNGGQNWEFKTLEGDDKP